MRVARMSSRGDVLHTGSELDSALGRGNVGYVVKCRHDAEVSHHSLVLIGLSSCCLVCRPSSMVSS